jgi:hypothetical protein
VSEGFDNRIVLPADGQRSFEELREAFREANRQRIRRALRKDSLVRYHKDGTVAGRVETGLMTDAPAGQDWRTVKDFMTSGGVVPEPSGEFQVIEGPGLDRELHDLARDIEAVELYEGVKYPDGNPEEIKHADSDEQPSDESST